jgi:NADPH:quinone reductase-like Zn-dependent oxidoreductase
MRQIVTTANGGVEMLRVQKKADPHPQPDELRIAVHAAGLNFADILARQGLYPDCPPKPCVMGYEVAGVIDEVGADVDQTLLGKAVIAMTRFGGQSEFVIVKPMQIFPKPE